MNTEGFTSADEKDRYVRSTFDAIAGRYDLLNRVVSLSLDQRWRRKAVDLLDPAPGDRVIDLGAGTGDLAFEVAGRLDGGGVTALDVSREMLRVGARKARRRGHGDAVTFTLGSAMDIPCAGARFHGAVTGFVLRNVSDLPRFFREAHRVLKPGARLVSLEISQPPGALFGPFYRLYFHHLMPRVGRALSRDPEAYTYLSESVKRVESPEGIARLIEAAGFRDVQVHPQMRGAVTIHTATKPPD